jgi:hypothetical protein
LGVLDGELYKSATSEKMLDVIRIVFVDDDQDYGRKLRVSAQIRAAVSLRG